MKANLDKDEFEAWKEEPMTRMFLNALYNYAQETKEQFESAAWSGRYISPEDQAWLAHLKGRSETATWFAEMDFDDLKSCFFEEE